jgi:hypothetical protein
VRLDILIDPINSLMFQSHRKKVYLMKRSLVLTIVVLLISALTVTSVLAARDPLIGAWESTDLDGSYQTLTIGGGSDNTYHVRYYDFGATVCGLNPKNNDLYAASARGLLTGSDGSITGTLHVNCMTRPPTFWGDVYIAYVYDANTDTIFDGAVFWTRK